MHEQPGNPAAAPARAQRVFALALSTSIFLVVVAGFRYTIGDALVHAAPRPPALLYLHALFAGTWIPFVVLQSALVLARRPRWHRRLGQWGMVHGALVPLTGLAAAVVMARWHLAQGDDGAAVSFPIPVNDALGFGVCFALALAWRRRAALHQRLMLMSACILSAPGWGRMPAFDGHGEWFYAGVDLLVLAAAVHDRVTSGRVHIVYRTGLPALVAGQLLTAAVRWSPWWLATAPRWFG